MKNIYTAVIGLFLALSLNVAAQSRVYAPDLRSPDNGDTGVTPDVLLDWDAVTGGTTDITYELQLDVTNDFANAVTFPTTDLTALQMSELLFGTTYYWHVRAYDGNEVSDWSETWSFSVTSSIILDKPTDGAMVFPDPIISWKPITGLTAYQLQIDTTYIWSAENAGTIENLNGSFILDANNKWVVGDNGFAAHFDGTAWNSVDVGSNKNLNAVFFTDANNGWIVGDGGTILIYNGSSWTQGDSLTGNDLNDVYFLNNNTGWVVGDAGTIFMYDGNWATEAAPDSLTWDINTVFAVSANNVYAGGQKGFIYNRSDTGWSSKIQLSGKRDVYSLWFKDANNGWVVGKSGKIFFFDGTDWTNQPSGITKDLYGVSFSGTTGFAVGKAGFMVRYTNGAWETVASGTIENMNTISLLGNEGVVAGNNGTLLKKAGEGFSSPYAKTVTVNKDLSEIKLANLLFGKTFYYRVRALTSLDTSDWSTVKSMTTYDKPALISPSNNADAQALLLTFTWQKYTGVTKYTIETSENENFDPALIYFSDSNSTTIDNFGFGETYYWRVNAIHAEDVSQWSDVYSFSTANAIVLTAPADGTINSGKSPRFEWDSIAGVTQYEIAVATDASFTDATVKSTDKSFFQMQNPLEYSTSYFWKVRGVVGLDTSGWSPVWQLTTKSPEDIYTIEGLQLLTVYPNPNKGIFQLTVNSTQNKRYSVSIIDMQGRVVYQKTIAVKRGETVKPFNLSLRQGIYTLSITDGRNKNTKKLFVQ